MDIDRNTRILTSILVFCYISEPTASGVTVGWGWGWTVSGVRGDRRSEVAAAGRSDLTIQMLHWGAAKN